MCVADMLHVKLPDAPLLGEVGVCTFGHENMITNSEQIIQIG